jgi:ZIP family zinc transporter
VLDALWWGMVGGSTLVVGALVGSFFRLPRRVNATVMAGGAGVLIASVAYELVGESAKSGTLGHTVVGMALGSLAFFVGDLVASRRGAGSRKMSSGSGRDDAASGTVLALGALLDGVPESAAIGITLLHGGVPSLAFIAAVAISNVPEGLSSAVAMRRYGKSRGYILGVWAAIAIASGIASAIGYGAMGHASIGLQAVVLAFAAGAVLTMLASTMLPEAAEEGGPMIGLVVTAGFLTAVLLDRL